MTEESQVNHSNEYTMDVDFFVSIPLVLNHNNTSTESDELVWLNPDDRARYHFY